jgi:V8-like Glu-specific endopeptidase
MAGIYPWSYTSYRAYPDVQGLYWFNPYVQIGKLYFTGTDGRNYVCSAAVVTTVNASVTWTAGHCVYTPPALGNAGFHTNFLFVPGLWTNIVPYGNWTGRQAWTLAGWQNGLFEYDHGAIYMNRGGPAPGTYLVGQLGSFGFAANLSRQQHFHDTGYPAAAPFDGLHQHVCAAPWAANDLPSSDPANPPTIGIGCDMTGGSSGGPWIVNLAGGWMPSPSYYNLLNGNNSYKYGGVPDKMYGPYFSQGAINLYNAVNALPTPP